MKPHREHRTEAEVEAMAFRERRERALRWGRESLAWYTREMGRQRTRLKIAEVTTIVLSGLVPVLILARGIATSALPGVAPAWVGSGASDLLAAAMAAGASISASVERSMQWRDNYIRFALTRTALEAELIRFETLSSASYAGKEGAGEETALTAFVARIDAHLGGEARSWAAAVRDSQRDGAGTGATS